MTAPSLTHGCCFSHRWLLLLLFAMAPLLLTACGQGKYTSMGTGGSGRVANEKAALNGPMEPGGEQAANTETYTRIVENPFMVAAKTPLSTFSIDVDTAAYSDIRRALLTENRLPAKDSVRIEEMINYFEYKYPQPEGEHPVAIATEVAACPWDSRLKLVRIGIQAKSIAIDELPPRNFVFMVDTSGSMNSPDRLPLLQESLRMLVNHLRARDRVAIVAYSGTVALVLPSTPGNNRHTIFRALDSLQARGSTAGGAAIKMAYQVAQDNFIEGGINRVIMGTDGDFNVGIPNREIIPLVEAKRKTGVYFTILGFGRGNTQHARMEGMAQNGNGQYAYIDSIAEAKKVFVENASAMHILADDVKVQVEFNPAKVYAWRLIGYENRLLKDQDFNDETKDAGDLGAGHRVTALYTIAPPGVKLDIPKIDKLKYQKPSQPAKGGASDEILNVKLRYKNRGATQSRLMVHPVKDASRTFTDASGDFRFAAAVAEFGLLLRNSKYKGSANYGAVERTAQATLGADPHNHRRGFVEMVRAAQRLAGNGE